MHTLRLVSTRWSTDRRIPPGQREPYSALLSPPSLTCEGQRAAPTKLSSRPRTRTLPAASLRVRQLHPALLPCHELLPHAVRHRGLGAVARRLARERLVRLDERGHERR